MTCSQGVVSADAEKAAPAGNVLIAIMFGLPLHSRDNKHVLEFFLLCIYVFKSWRFWLEFNCVFFYN